jgi:hypothetical protein
MKKLQRLSLAVVFTVVLTSAALAGDISTPGIAQPTPTPTPQSAMAAGEIPISKSSNPSETDVSEISWLTDVALNVMQVMLSVF